MMKLTNMLKLYQHISEVIRSFRNDGIEINKNKDTLDILLTKMVKG